MYLLLLILFSAVLLLIDLRNYNSVWKYFPPRTICHPFENTATSFFAVLSLCLDHNEWSLVCVLFGRLCPCNIFRPCILFLVLRRYLLHLPFCITLPMFVCSVLSLLPSFTHLPYLGIVVLLILSCLLSPFSTLLLLSGICRRIFYHSSNGILVEFLTLKNPWTFRSRICWPSP